MSDLQTLVAQEVAKQLATFTADTTVKKVLNYLKSSGGGGLPLGHLFAWPFQTPPDGAIQCNGAEYNRALYADFFAHASSKGWVKTESEWQQIASTNGGFCPWYSDGDGSTTFRTPKFAPFMQVAIASGNVGNYHEAGLPEVESFCNSSGGNASAWTNLPSYAKNIQNTEAYTLMGGTGIATSSNNYYIKSYASLQNAVYGGSNTVQPESSEWMICVVVFGVATNVGSTDVSNVMSAVAQVQANPNLQGQAHIVEAWKSDSSWYRVWSDGFIEQGGITGTLSYTVTFPKAFSNTDYQFVATKYWANGSNAWNPQAHPTNATLKTNTGIRVVTGGDYYVALWAAFGY